MTALPFDPDAAFDAPQSLAARVQRAQEREAALREEIAETRRAIAREVREAREARGLRLVDVAAPLGLTRPDLSRLEMAGPRGPDAAKFFRPLAAAARVIEAHPLPVATTEAGAGAGPG